MVCPDSWHQIQDRCYTILNESKTWYEAVSRCQAKGAELLVINTEVGFYQEVVKKGNRLPGDTLLLDSELVSCF